jgi:hypothetical protein
MLPGHDFHIYTTFLEGGVMRLRESAPARWNSGVSTAAGVFAVEEKLRRGFSRGF